RLPAAAPIEPDPDPTPPSELPAFTLDEEPPRGDLDERDERDDLDETRMSRLDAAELRQVFAVAEAHETTAVFRGPVPEEAHPSVIRPVPKAALESVSTSNVIEVDSAELESVPDVADLDSPDGTTTEVAALPMEDALDDATHEPE